ncbi:MAG: hypothetical protein R2864_00760 [Syntrophotaleaceae bacterium]
MLTHQPDCTLRDVELLKAGRQYRLSPKAKLTLGRNLQTNERIQELATSEHTLLRAANFSGPCGLLSGQTEEQDIAIAAAIVAAYGKGQNEAQVSVLCTRGDQRWQVTVAPMGREEIEAFIVP